MKFCLTKPAENGANQYLQFIFDLYQSQNKLENKNFGALADKIGDIEIANGVSVSVG